VPACGEHGVRGSEMQTKFLNKSRQATTLRSWLFGNMRVKRWAAYYWRRLVRVRATPHEVALGCAMGVFVAFTPFIGFQMLLAGFLAYVLRVSIPAAMLGTFAGNPLSWPAMWASSYLAGAWILGVEPAAVTAEQLIVSAAVLNRALTELTPGSIDNAVLFFAPVVKPMIYGSLLMGLIAAAGSYYPTHRAVRVFQKRRRPV
jgi:uncharacterized protein